MKNCQEMLDLDKAGTAELTMPLFISTGKPGLLGPALMSAPAIQNLSILNNRREKKWKNAKMQGQRENCGIKVWKIAD